MGIKRKVFRFWLRFSSFIRGLDVNQEKRNATQELGIKIFEKSVTKPDADLLLAPLSSTYYIYTTDIVIIMEGSELKIINGRYEYHIIINERIKQSLSMRFKRVMEKRRKKMEFEILSKTRRSLETILDELN